MAGFFIGEETQERMDLWLTRSLVLLSFGAHLILALLAGIRRRRNSGVRRSLVWLAYHVTEIVTPIALGKVFLDTATAHSEKQLLATYREQQMFAFWAPFLLLHLGRPDNIISYALENKGLSPTHIAGLVLAIGGAIYGSYKQRFMRGDGALRVAFFIMLFFGSYKYVERAVALHRASFANIRRSSERKMVCHFSSEERDGKHENDKALLQAHRHLRVTMGAFAEHEVGVLTNEGAYPDWKYLSKVVEMEASLMYDILYTKASVIHTWGGYTVRVLSLLAISTALYLFHSKEGQAMESADWMITYTLLVGTLVFDVRWLLRALGSTWTYAFLIDFHIKPCVEESKGRYRRTLWAESRGHRSHWTLGAECRGRTCWTLWANPPWQGRLRKARRRAVMQSWYWLRRLLISLDPSQLSLRSGPGGHRLLPGSGVGQRNLLHDCTTPPWGRLEKMISICAGPGKKKIDVKDELLEVMCRYLVLTLRPIAGMRPVSELGDYMRLNAKNYSFETNLIALHVGTDIFLLCRPASPGIESEASAQYEKEIRVISDYMMFLLDERQHMVFKPGDEGSEYKKARLDLKFIWHARGTNGSRTTVRETKLANILLDMDATRDRKYGSNLLSVRNKTLALGAYWAFKLLHELDPASYGSGRHTMPVRYISRLEDFILIFTDEAQSNIKRYRDRGQQSELLKYMLQLILLSWERLLTFASEQCSRESHAKQLSCGGELLTIVWLMNQHKTIVPSE